jgi:transcriptional regulator with XRE-family HTH domain
MPSEEARILVLLDSLIRVRKLSIRDVERRLGMSMGTLRRVLLGETELKYRHVSDVLGVLEIPERSFFRLVFENDDPDSNLDRVVATAQRMTAEPAETTVTLTKAELEALIESTVRRLGFPRPPKKPGPAGGPRPKKKEPKRR